MISNFANYICRYTINNRKNILEFFNGRRKTIYNPRYVSKTVENYGQIDAYSSNNDSGDYNENVKSCQLSKSIHAHTLYKKLKEKR